ncbi:MAG: LssY C-terminal domain-containing protein [Candidatus Omnitrophica bacterium]|nr:LssY C-terminal domain-containing protein [Candidatus Omnitrophota bacterium]
MRQKAWIHPAALGRRAGRALGLVLGVVVSYGSIAYGLMPTLWEHYENYPAWKTAPRRTQTREGIPGDVLNAGLVGSRTELVRAMLDAGWHPADPITLHSSLDIARSVLLGRPYPTAPVSNLYLWGRPQDLAFEQPVGSNARQRHHVRWWRANGWSLNGRALWIGAATYDRSVGISHFTGKITHHIGPNVDEERDKMFTDLRNAGQLIQLFQVTGVGPTLDAHNGAGDRYFTDGEVTIGVLARNNQVQTAQPQQLPNPPVVRLKSTLWTWLKTLID